MIFVEVVQEFKLPERYPGCSGSRNLSDNISDLKAQIAANQKVKINEYIHSLHLILKRCSVFFGDFFRFTEKLF